MAKRKPESAKGKRRAQLNLARIYADSGTAPTPVNREFTFEPGKITVKAKKQRKAMFSAKQRSSKTLKREIVKSLILASLILSLELMLYLVWK